MHIHHHAGAANAVEIRDGGELQRVLVALREVSGVLTAERRMT
jgi:hypothetical protein